MSDKLHIGTTTYLHSEPLIARAVSTAGLDYDVTACKTIDECTLKTLAGDFDAGECSIATFVKVCEAGGAKANNFVGLPVFAKKLVSQYAFCRTDSDLDGHASLAGKRIAVPQFWVTAAIWHRYFLEQSGVPFDKVIWCPLGKDRIDGMPYPANYQMDWSLVGKKPAEVLRSGAADCFIFADRRNARDDEENQRDPMHACARREARVVSRTARTR
jgi:4,5-dihydroxyphthalate decarboxylase